MFLYIYIYTYTYIYILYMYTYMYPFDEVCNDLLVELFQAARWGDSAVASDDLLCESEGHDKVALQKLAMQALPVVPLVAVRISRSCTAPTIPAL